MNTPQNKATQVHESASRHVTGEAKYVDDFPEPHGMLFGLIVSSSYAHASILNIKIEAAQKSKGIHAVLRVSDIPGDPYIGPIFHDEPLLAIDTVHFHGQAIALIVGESYAECRAAAALVQIDYSPLPSITTLQDAITKDSFHGDAHTIARGEAQKSIASATHQFNGEVQSGGQDHFYLETHAALCIPEEGQCFRILSSTQHPTEIQKMAARILGIGAHQVTCDVPRMGGGFGGKESQATLFAALAALGSFHTKRPVKIWLNRDSDMCWTGKRHPFYSRYSAGFDADGRIKALEVDIYSDGGWTMDLSHPVLDRALFHLDNSYFIPELRFTGRVCHTNLPSNTAFRGFGGPQGVVVIEQVLNRIAQFLSLDPAVVRKRNYYGGAPRNKAPYGQEIILEDNRLERVHSELFKSSSYNSRRTDIDKFNTEHQYLKRGIGFQPIKFGISFTKALLNQAGAFINIYTDGRIQLNHSGTEMGQGLYTKMISICADNFGVPMNWVRNMTTSTEKVPNTSPTAASSGSDLNGAAVQAACDILKERLKKVAAEHFLGKKNTTEDKNPKGVNTDALIFKDGKVFDSENPNGHSIEFSELCTLAWLQQVSLSTTGYYRTPGIAYDHESGRGTPFFYYAYGGAVTEVEVNTLTGEYRMMRVDILHDAGRSLVPSIDIGQVEGAFVQGAGWLSMEELITSAEGHLMTHSPSTYKIPSFGDTPIDFRVNLLENAPQNCVIHGSKAVGEPPFLLGISLITALQHAIQSGKDAAQIQLPCTPENVLRLIHK
jgi:xanthine dehydrogenase large subunit